MSILVLNCGSSSLKYQLIDMNNESVLAKGLCERIGEDMSKITHKVPGRDNYSKDVQFKTHTEAVKMVFDLLTDSQNGVVKSIDEIEAIGHRVLHGGTKFTQSTKVDEKVKDAIRECFDLGPLHNPANLMGIEACEKAVPGKPNVAVFDTTFGMSLGAAGYLYGIPYEYYEKYGIRRYGFHGTSHMYVTAEAIKFNNLDKDKARIIVCHLGNGASISASIGGKCVDTSMGLTPLEGLIMGTRSGDIDPAVIQYIMKKENKTIDEVLDILNKKSGYYGMTNYKIRDHRDLTAAVEAGDENAKITLKAYERRIVKYIGAYIALLNGVDCICFAGGIGENSGDTRWSLMQHFSYMGIKLDKEKNSHKGVMEVISAPDSSVIVMDLPTNEELMIARETKRLA